MKRDDVDLSSVNWEHGMLLTPDHFIRQERYVDSTLLWILRYATEAHGLVGGGPRVTDSERGAAKHDPILVLQEDPDSLQMTVAQCRGLTPAGGIVEIDPERPLQCEIASPDVASTMDSLVLIVAEPHEKDAVDGVVDRFNPQMRSERRPAYRLTVNVTADEAPHALVVARIARPRAGAPFERDAAFIPPCTSLSSHSELTAAWRRIVESLSLLADRFTELHRAMREFLQLFTERGIETEGDLETMRFVDRMVPAVQDALYDALDPAQTPQRFFARMRRFLHSAATFVQLSPAVQQYFDTLRDVGETELIAPLQQQKHMASTTPRIAVSADLAVDVRFVLQCLNALHSLERAFEGKYVDFRVSTTLESMNFVFDRGGKTLYRAVVGHSRVAGSGDELAIYFSQLRLEGREKYRAILIGEARAEFERGSRIVVEISVNESAGFQRPPIRLAYEVATWGQRNFEFDFEVLDTPTITDLRITVPGHLPIRTAMLFTRHRFFASPAASPAAAPSKPAESHAPPRPSRTEGEPPRREPGREGRMSRLEPRPETPPDPRLADEAEAPPWERPRRRRLDPA